MANLELRPRLATEIVDAAVQLYRRHFAELITLSAVFFVPYLVILLIMGGEPTVPEEMSADMVGIAGLLLVGWAVGSLLEAAIVIGVSNAYLSGEADVANALRGTRTRILPILAAVLLKWLFIGLAFAAAMMVAVLFSGLLIALIAVAGGGTVVAGVIGVIVMIAIALPVGLYAFAAMFAVPATVVLEGRGALDGLRRSRELSRGLKRRIIGALGVPMLGFLVFQLFVGGLGALLPGPRALSLLLEQAVTIAVYPIIAVIATLLYYDARIRKEGFDIEVMAAELEPAGERPATYTATDQA